MSLPRLFVIGDSISMHYGPYLERYLAGAFEYRRKTGQEPPVTASALARDANGGDSSAVLAYLDIMLEAQALQADVLLINCGLHDIKTNPETGARQVPLDLYRRNLEGIVARVKAAGIRMVWCRTTPCDEKVHNSRPVGFHRYAADCLAYNQAADAIMAAAGIPAIDLHGFTASIGPELYCDHVHFHEPVREKQAAFIAGWLMALICPAAGLNC